MQDHFELLEMSWPDHYESRYGFWCPYVLDVIHRHLDCGDLHCGHEYLLAFSFKRRHLCSSCHQKRVVEFGERLISQVLKQVPHRQGVFSIPKRPRIYFLFNRKLLPIKKILPHLGPWETRKHGPPQAPADPIPTFEADLTLASTYSQLPLIDYWNQ